MMAVRAASFRGKAFVVERGGRRLLLECNAPLAEVRALIAGRPPAACLVSHRHRDHLNVAAALALLRAGVPVLAPADCKRLVSGATPARHMATAVLGPFAVTAFAVDHDAPCLGYVVDSGRDRLVYLTDAASPPPVAPPLTTCLMLECNHERELLAANVRSGRVARRVARRQAARHLDLGGALAYLRAVAAVSPGLRDVWLVHMSTVSADADRCLAAFRAETPAAVRIA